jgi:hypothetical protein
METVRIESTPNTLRILLDEKKGLIELEGRSFPENTPGFFKPIVTWVKEYADKPAEQTHCIIKLEYFNSSSQKFIVDILRSLEEAYKKGNKVKISWLYKQTDADILEAGQEFQSLFRVDFEVKPY